MKDGKILESILTILTEKISEMSSYFIDLAVAILLLLLVIEIIKSAVDLVSGDGFNVGMKFIVYIVFLVLLIRFPSIYEGINRGLMEEAGLQENFSALSNYVKVRHDSNLLGPNPTGANFYIKLATGIDTSKFDLDYVLRVIFTSISHFVCFILLIIIILIISQKYAVFLLLLSMGPIPLSLMVSEETRSVGIGWIKSVFSKFMTLFMYSVILRISHRFIVDHQYEIYKKAGGELGLMSNFSPAIILIFMILFLFKITGDLCRDLIN
jgi:hypothetical protein